MRALPVVVVMLLGGCWWPMPGQGPNRQAHNPGEETIGVDTVRQLWRAWVARLDDGPAGDPVTSTAGVHVADGSNVHTFHTDTGSRRWLHAVAAPLRVTQPFVHGDQVLVGRWNPTATRDTDPSGSDATVALDAATGAPAGDVGPGVVVGMRGGQALLSDDHWRRFGGMVQIPVWIQEPALYDLESGGQVWSRSFFSFRNGDPAATAPPPPTSLMVTDEWLLHTGQGVIDTENPLPQEWGNGVRGYRRVDPPICSVFGTESCPDWAVPLDGTTATPAVLSDDQSVAYVGTDTGMHAIDVATATVVWSWAHGAVADAPALADGSLYVPLRSGSLVALDAVSGRTRWRSSTTGDALIRQPAVANGVVFTAAVGGEVRAYAADCAPPICDPIRRIELGSEITGGPAVSNGQLYVGTADGRLVAFAPKEG